MAGFFKIISNDWEPHPTFSLMLLIPIFIFHCLIHIERSKIKFTSSAAPFRSLECAAVHKVCATSTRTITYKDRWGACIMFRRYSDLNMILHALERQEVPRDDLFVMIIQRTRHFSAVCASSTRSSWLCSNERRRCRLGVFALEYWRASYASKNGELSRLLFDSRTRRDLARPVRFNINVWPNVRILAAGQSNSPDKYCLPSTKPSRNCVFFAHTRIQDLTLPPLEKQFIIEHLNASLNLLVRRCLKG